MWPEIEAEKYLKFLTEFLKQASVSSRNIVQLGRVLEWFFHFKTWIVLQKKIMWDAFGNSIQSHFALQKKTMNHRWYFCQRNWWFHPGFSWILRALGNLQTTICTIQVRWEWWCFAKSELSALQSKINAYWKAEPRSMNEWNASSVGEHPGFVKGVGHDSLHWRPLSFD